MSNRYEIKVWSRMENWVDYGQSKSEPYWYALVWDGLTGDEVEEFCGWERQDVLRQAAAKRAEMERKLKSGTSDISPDEAMRFSRAFLDVFNSVNKSNDQMATAFAFADVLATTLQLAKRGQS